MAGIKAPGHWERIATALLLLCAAFQLASRFPQIAEASRGEYCRADSDYHVERGEAILHGVPQYGFARAMPSYSVPNAFLCGHLSVSSAAAVRFAVLLACAVLVFALGALLYSGLCGAGAVFLYSFAPPASESGERWLYTLAVLIAAYFLVRRSRSPAPGKNAWLAAGLGATLLMLSSLCLFPFLLALYEWARDRRVRWRDAAGVCLIPFLFLLPWIVMNWRLTGRFVVFEDGRVDDNILTGALGFVHTMGIGNSRKMIGLSMGENVFVWAALQVLRHPLNFLSAVGQRAAYAASLHPLLVVGAAASIWISRKVEDRRQLALLAVYLFGIHILMPVQENYFVPAWPILAVLSAGLLGAWTAPASARLNRMSATAVTAIFVGLLSVQASVLWLVSSYPSRAHAVSALDREISRYPRDAWLWSERGMRLLREGRPAQASGDLGRAFGLAPSRDREVNYAWALLAQGGPAARIWERRTPGRIFMVSDIRERILLGIYLALDGRRAEAVVAEIEALKYKRSFETAGGSDIAAGSPVPHLVLEIIASWPAAARPALIDFFSGIPGFEFAGKSGSAQAWLDMADTAEKPNQRQAALEILAFTAAKRPAALDPEKMWSMALSYRDIASYSRSLSIMKRPEMGGPKGSDMLLDMAAMAGKGGHRREALEILAFVESTSLDPDRARRLALVYQDAGSCARSLAVMKKTDMGRPTDVHMVLDMAARAAKDGQRPAALASLAFVESLRLDPEKTRTLALAYRDIGGYARALAVMKRAKMAGPKDAGMILDLAVRAARDNQRPAALTSLAFAESLALDAETMRELALGYRALGESRGVARIRRRMGDEDGLALDQAESAVASADKRSALAHLTRVRDSRLVEPEARRLVLAYQNLGEYSAALAVVKRRILAHPGDSQWRNDSGVLHSLLGERDEAIADWSSAISLDPDGLAPYLSLGSLYSSLNRRKEALDVYERASARRHTKEDEGVLRRILEERRKLLPAPAAAPRP
jgi:tetratricopeptide (TPR) repeat protein